MKSEKRSFRVLASFAVTLLILLAACAGDTATVPIAAKGEPAPEFTLEDLEGNPVSLSDTTGKVRLLDFWATWCAPCREEVPMFKELDEKYGPHGFQIVAISMDAEGREIVRPFVEDNGIGYLNLIGNDDVARAFGVLGFPSAYLLDRDGKIVETFLGAKPRKQLEERVRGLLGLETAA